ncbi:hypothetical protein [Nonlabens sp.]|uniref:hypothetical protein n=1 Tax=Nonlabens sp. TaxID=1888209 RepID=UPI0025EFC57F|nr:hypothetical protein [Nonlabens sp.]
MTESIRSNTKYLTKSIVNKCFTLGKDCHIDKVICGNGFTSRFAELKPPTNKVNILIAPNRAVIMDKEKQHIVKSTIETTIPTKFFYKGSSDYNFEGAELLCFVADSFLQYKKTLAKNKDKIHYVLIDEYHSTVIQSKFRTRLINFITKVRDVIGEAPALTTVTATPLHFSRIDIRIKTDEKFITPFNINLTNNEVDAIKEIKKLLEAKENVIVATNSKKVIYNLRDENDSIDADFVVGANLMSSIVEVVNVNQNDRSNFKIISSKGFEGFDVDGKDYNVFFFEDRSMDYSTFYLANLYQAINRCRDGAKRVEYVRLDLGKTRKQPFKNIEKAVDGFIKRTDKSIHQKQAKEFEHYRPFVTFDQDKAGVYSINKNEDGIRLFNESNLYDNKDISNSFKAFLEARKISITDLRNIPTRLPRVQVRNNTKIKRLKENEKLINKLQLFDSDYSLMAIRTDKTKDAIKNIETYLRRKNYDGYYLMTDSQIKVLEILKDKDQINSILKDLVRSYELTYIEKLGVSKSEAKRKQFKEKSRRVLIEMLQIFTNNKMYIRRNLVANRDYNILVEIGEPEIEFIASLVGFTISVIDIKTCFARILYALNGLELPSNFYGSGKENKLKINVLLNDFMLNTKKNTSYNRQKANALKSLKEVGIDEKVIDYLMTNYFDSKHRGDLFNFLSFHEKKIIEKLTKQLTENRGGNVFRRHDSVVVFNQKIDTQSFVGFDYLNQLGWFSHIPKVSLEERYASEDGTVIYMQESEFINTNIIGF